MNPRQFRAKLAALGFRPAANGLAFVPREQPDTEIGAVVTAPDWRLDRDLTIGYLRRWRAAHPAREQRRGER